MAGPVAAREPLPPELSGQQPSIIGGASALTACYVVARLLSFLRNVIIARLVGPEDFGIAALFAISVTALEMLTELSPEVLLVQDARGTEPRFQRSIHLVKFVRGALSALLLLALAAPMARFFDAAQATWAFRTLALVPLVRGLGHTDFRRMQRTRRFRPTILLEVGAETVLVLAAWPLGERLGDYSALLWLLVGKACLHAAGSHVLAERPYRWALDRADLRRVLAFGWPLFLNGFLIFSMNHGDRLIVGGAYGATDLGVYSVAWTLTSALTFLVAQVGHAAFLPWLSAAQDQPALFRRRTRSYLELLGFAGGAITVLLVLAGGAVVSGVFGPGYAAAASFVGWMGAMNGVRILREAPTHAAIARGDTRAVLLSNLFRVSSLAGALAAAALGAGLAWIAFAGFCGEALALVALLLRLRARHALPLRPIARGLLVPAGCGLAAAGLALSGLAASRAAGLLFAAALVALLAASSWRSFLEARARS